MQNRLILLLQKKKPLGNMSKPNFFKTIFIICVFLLNFAATAAYCYETALIVYPENNKNWKNIYFAKKDDETITRWIPSYSYKNDWVESTVFHSYRWAKGNSCYKFMLNLLAGVESRNKTMKTKIIKDSSVDSVAIWCVDKTPAMNAQCEILRVTSSYEGLISIHYINKNPKYFLQYQQDDWLSRVRNIRIYYSYFRWDRVTGKETSIQLQ